MAGMSVPAAPLLSVEGLEVTFGTDAPAVCGVDLAVRSGQTVAVVGESGSGKSTTAAAILGLLPAGGRITAGRVVFDGRDITGADAKRLRSIRGREIGYVPQDPMTNLNPVWKVGFQVTEALRANTDGRAARRRAVELLAEAGLPDPAKQAGRYPHQLSGGMCQRALIAIGLAGRPRLLIADEPTSALDVTVQRQVLDHLQGLTDELGTALLLITHDLALAAQRAEAVVVVRRGVVVESGAAQSILQSDDRLGRPRSDADVGPRLELLADVVTHPTLASAPVVAAVAHGELLTLRPFGCADGVVARAVSRLVTIATGLDPHGLGVPEVIWMRQPAEYHDAARRFAGGTPDGVAGWLLLCCGAMLDGAREALSIAESLSPG